MQGYFGLVYLDSFVSVVPLTFTLAIDKTNIPQITSFLLSSGNWHTFYLTGDFLENMTSFMV